jgi:hypothetical protein
MEKVSYNLHSSKHIIIRVIKSAIVRPAEREGVRKAYKIIVGNLKGREHLEGQGVDEKIMKEILEERV